MPELPEVETVRRGLQKRTQGRSLHRVEVVRQRVIAAPADPQCFCKALEGATVSCWKRRGKYLLASLVDGADSCGQWGVHLRMTGQFHWIENATPPCSHTRVRLWLQSGIELRYIDVRSFGQMWWIPPHQSAEEVITGLTRLGPEPFSSAFSATYLRDRLKRSRRPIKNALLDQGLVAGVGNIYADESLFAAGIRPHIASSQLSIKQLQRLRNALLNVLEKSIGAGGTSFSDFRDLSGTNGQYGGMAWVYRRTGEACRCCGTPIQKSILAGRSSHWCPKCQHP